MRCSSSKHNYQIFCDSLQEGMWFKALDKRLNSASLEVIPNKVSEQIKYGIDAVLEYDRPDIILQDNSDVIFVLERTVEVPSGHNVGQRFGRLVAAAKNRIPVVYFGPYAAYKHGGETAGPRYMNLRLFYSLKKVSDYFNTAVTTIKWPVDKNYEVLKNSSKDDRLVTYLKMFFDYYESAGLFGLSEHIKKSDFQKKQYDEQKEFADNEIQNPEQYDVPPDSVEILSVEDFETNYTSISKKPCRLKKIELYHVGMTNIRSDPYAGMAALYHYLYGSEEVSQILHFPNITKEAWKKLKTNTKTYRMFKEFAFAILFKDGLVFKENL